MEPLDPRCRSNLMNMPGEGKFYPGPLVAGGKGSYRDYKYSNLVCCANQSGDFGTDALLL